MSTNARLIGVLLKQVDELNAENARLKTGGQCTLAALQQKTEKYLDRIDAQREKCVDSTDIPTGSLPGFVEKRIGKVRDQYICEDVVVMVATDRQSAFDRHLASVPFKGQVLNLTSKWWFEQTRHIIPNHMLATPKSNTTIGKKCFIFPIEFVMRGYITGSTSTSLWMNYNKGVRLYCGHQMPEGLIKNQKLWENLLTPTTKSDVHDELISAEEVVKDGHMTQGDWDACATAAKELFAFGQQQAAKRGLILVDTKYEFGKDKDGRILLVDEIHTPDSSRYWISSSYEERMAQGESPENIDKEFLRLWFRANCDPYKDETLPDPPVHMVNELSRRYIMLYEMITGQSFGDQFSKDHGNIEEALADYFASRL